MALCRKCIVYIGKTKNQEIEKKKWDVRRKKERKKSLHRQCESAISYLSGRGPVVMIMPCTIHTQTRVVVLALIIRVSFLVPEKKLYLLLCRGKTASPPLGAFHKSYFVVLLLHVTNKKKKQLNTLRAQKHECITTNGSIALAMRCVLRIQIPNITRSNVIIEKLQNC